MRLAGRSFRLGEKLKVEGANDRGLLSGQGLMTGRVVDLGWVWLRQDGVVRVRVIGVWSKGQPEPWWLATNREESVKEVAGIYGRRMGIEEQLRDSKGAGLGSSCFGLGFGVRRLWRV